MYAINLFTTFSNGERQLSRGEHQSLSGGVRPRERHVTGSGKFRFSAPDITSSLVLFERTDC